MANNTALTTSALKVVAKSALKVVTPVLKVVTTPLLKVEEDNGLVNSTGSVSDSNSTVLTPESIDTNTTIVTNSNVTKSAVTQTNCSYPKPNPCGADTCYHNAVTYICKCRDGYVNKTPQSCELKIAEAKAGPSDDDDDSNNTVYFLAGALGLVSLIVIASCVLVMVYKRKYNKAMKDNSEDDDIERPKPSPPPTLKKLSEPRPFFTAGKIKSPPPVRKAPSQVYSDVSTEAGSSDSSSASGSAAPTPKESSDESSED